MTPEQWREAQALIAEALGLDASGQERLVAETYPADTELDLRRELLDLLNNYTLATVRLPALALSAAGPGAPEPLDRSMRSTTLPTTPDADRTRPPEFRLDTGDMCGRYEIVRHLQSGGMGQVYLAEDTELGTQVALKILPAHALESPDARMRLRREARHAAELRGHPHIATLFDVIEVELRGRRFPVLVMEYVEGRTAKAIAADGPVGLPRALRWAAQIAEAIEYAHDRGLLHCDLKPANVQITPDDRAKVLDFGIARAIHGGAERSESLAGTPAYMAPEQIVEGKFIEAGDVYSLGVLLFELVTGRRPFEGPDVTQLLVEVLGAPPPKASALAPAVPAALDALLQRVLAKAPRQRHQSAAEFRRDLEAVIASLRPVPVVLQSRAAGYVGIATGVLAYLTLLGLVSSWTLDLTLGRTGDGAEFRTESAFWWPLWGARSVLGEVLFALVGVVGLLVTREAGRLAYSVRPVRQRAARYVEAVRRWIVGADAVAIGRALLVLQVVIFGVYFWSFVPLLETVLDVSLDLRPLRDLWRGDPATAAYQNQQMYFVAAQLLVFGAAWRALWPRLRARQDQWRPLLAGAVAVLACTLLLTPPIYRLVHHNDGELVEYQSELCYLVGQSSGRGLLFCPVSDTRRRVIVPLQSADLVPTGVREDVFTIFTRTN